MSPKRVASADLEICRDYEGSIGVRIQDYMSYSLNSLKGDYIGGNIGDYYRGY